MKTKITLLILVTSSFAFAQRADPAGTGGIDNSKFSNFALKELADKVNRNKASDKYTGVAGTPYWIDAWSKGSIKAATGHVLNNILVRFNVLENRIEVSENDKLFSPTEPITEFTIDKSEKSEKEEDGAIKTTKLTFRNGFANKKELFYNIVYDGKNKVLLGKSKSIVKKAAYGEPPSSSIIEESTYYVYKSTGELQKIKRSNSGLLKALDDAKRKEIELYITTNKLKVENDNDLIEVMKYYDSIASNSLN